MYIYRYLGVHIFFLMSNITYQASYLTNVQLALGVNGKYKIFGT